MISAKLLKRLSLDQIRGLIKAKTRLDQTAKLEKEKARLERRIKKIEKKIAKLSGDTGPSQKRKKGMISAAGRKRIAAAQRGRWAKIKAEQGKEKHGS